VLQATQYYQGGGEMLVKCKICGNKADRNEAYKVVVDGKNHYYCNKNEYNEWRKKKDIKDRVYNLIYEIFDRKVTNTILYKEIGELADVYTYEKILAYLTDNENYLTSAIKKSFVSEYAQIRYFTAILKNSLTDFQFEREPKVEINKLDMPDVSNNQFSRKKKKKSLSEYEKEVGEQI